MARTPLGPGGHSLRGVAILDGLSTAALAAIETRCSWKRYATGETIIDYLDSSDNVFFIVSGQARASIYSSQGKLVTFSELGPGEMIGEYAALDGSPRSAGIEARSDCLVASMSGRSFRHVVESEPTVAMALLRSVVARIRALTNRVYEFSTLAVSNRIQAELLRLAKEGHVSDNSAEIFPVPLHADVASRTSTHREAVAREFSRLSKLGLLERRGRRLIIRDVRRLDAMIREVTEN